MITPSPENAPPVDHAQWFAEEVQPHEPALRSYLRGAFPAVRDVDDVVQESYARVWRRQTMRPIKSAKAFLFTVARRLVFDHLRRERRLPVAAVEDVDELGASGRGANIVESIGEAEKIGLLIEAIDALPARCREVVVLRKLELLPQRNVAERLRISEKGVENQLARGLERCRAFLEARGVRACFNDGWR